MLTKEVLPMCRLRPEEINGCIERNVRMFRFLGRLQADDTEDLRMETYLSVLRALPNYRFEAEGKEFAFFHRVSFNAGFSYLRRQGLVRGKGSEFPEDIADPGAGTAIRQAELLASVSLSESDKAILLDVYAGYSAEEIKERHGLPSAGAVRQRIHRIQSRARDERERERW